MGRSNRPLSVPFSRGTLAAWTSFACLLPACAQGLPDPPGEIGLFGDWIGTVRFEQGPNDISEHGHVPLDLPIDATWFVRTNSLLLGIEATGDDYGDCDAEASALTLHTNPAPLIVEFVDCWDEDCTGSGPCGTTGAAVSRLQLAGEVEWWMEEHGGVANPVARFSGLLLGSFEWEGACTCPAVDYTVPSLGEFALARGADPAGADR